METISLDYAIDIFEKLPPEDQVEAINIMKKIQTEKKRENILREFRELKNSIHDGTAKGGSFEDLKNDLLS
jgi:hypothetical protein